MKMTLKIWTPEKTVLETGAVKIMAEGRNGHFCLLPRHVDFLSVLIPGILSYSDGDREFYWAVDQGLLVKCGRDVMVSTPNAVAGDLLADLELELKDKFKGNKMREGEMRIAMEQLEADFIRHFAEMQKLR